MKPESSCWIAIIRPHNLAAIIAESGLSSYAGSAKEIQRLQVGDHVALYRTARGPAEPGGVVATFDIAGTPRFNQTTSALKLYPVRFPCTLTGIALSSPLPLKSLVQHLSFIKNKENAGAYLQRAWAAIPAEDFYVLRSALAKHMSEKNVHTIADEVAKYRLALEQNSRQH